MTKKKTPVSAPKNGALHEIIGETKRIGNAITIVGLLQARGVACQVVGGKGTYWVKLNRDVPQGELEALLKSLEKAHPTAKWWSNKKEL
jgi:hypothetical protein